MIRGTIVARSPLFGSAEHGKLYYYLTSLQCSDRNCLLLVVVAAGAQRRLIIGESIAFETYKSHGHWMQVNEGDLNFADLPCASASLLGEMDGQLPFTGFLAEALNYRGVISSISSHGNYAALLLDDRVKLIAPDSLRRYHGTHMTICNLRRSASEAVDLIFCPIFSSIDTEGNTMFEWSHNLSVCDLGTWRYIREQIKNQLRDIVSLQYFKNDSSFEELGVKVAAALSGDTGGANPHEEFAAHANRGSCKFCTKVLPTEWIVPSQKSECKGAFIGLLSVCPRTGRPLIKCHGFEPYLLYHSAERLRFGHLVIAYPAMLVAEDEHSLLLVERISYIAPLAEKEQHTLRGDYDLFMVKHVHPPVLLSKNEPLQINVEAYRFGKFSKNGTCDKMVMEHQKSITDLGGTMRLGAYVAVLKPGTIVANAYGDLVVSERHRHRFEVNTKYRQRLEDAGLVCSGLSPDGALVEFIELPNHPFWVGTQAHPEFKSRPDRPHPLFASFMKAAVDRKNTDNDVGETA